MIRRLVIARSVVAGALIGLLAPLGLGQHVLPRPTPPRWDFIKFVYYADGAANGISVGRATLSGSSRTTLADDSLVINVRSLTVDRQNGHVYVPTLSGILRMNSDGANPVMIRPETFGVRAVDLDPVNGRLYYTPGNGAVKIKSCRLDGSDVKELVSLTDMSPPLTVFGVHIDGANDRLYWWDAGPAGFRAALLTPGGDVACLKELFATGSTRDTEIDLVNRMLYWIPFAGDQMLRLPIPADPANPCDPPTSLGTPEVVVVNHSAFFNLDTVSVLPVKGSPSAGVIAWTDGESRLRWRNLQGTWPVPVHDSGRLLPASHITSIDLMNGPVRVIY